VAFEEHGISVPVGRMQIRPITQRDQVPAYSLANLDVQLPPNPY
jgi:hypothetical protein